MNYSMYTIIIKKTKPPPQKKNPQKNPHKNKNKTKRKCAYISSSAGIEENVLDSIYEMLFSNRFLI